MLAAFAADRGLAERSGRLWGAVEAWQQREPRETWEMVRQRFEPRVLNAGGEQFEKGRAAGLRLTLEEVVEDELADA